MWRTQIVPEKKIKTIDHRSKIFLIGSCFSSNIGKRLVDAGFQTCENPFGILFNPKSIASNLLRLVEGRAYGHHELVEHEGLFHSMDHHGRFSSDNAEQTLGLINDEFQNGREALLDSDYLFISLGSAWTYVYSQTNLAVANCHRIPQDQFEKRLISNESVVADIQEVIEAIQKYNPKLQVVVTVSPVRHWKDGATENQLSKSHLIVASNELKERIPSCDYFPAYELLVDDLRDYRFYEEDMLHPNKLAVDYVWEFFGDSYFNESTKSLCKTIEKKSRIMGHRFSDPDEGRLQKEKVKKEISALIDANISG